MKSVEEVRLEGLLRSAGGVWDLESASQNCGNQKGCFVAGALERRGGGSHFSVSGIMKDGR